MSEPEKQEALPGQEFKETNDDRTHHLVLQLPGIERNHIRVVVRDSVLSFSAAIPNVRDNNTPPPPQQRHPPTTTTHHHHQQQQPPLSTLTHLSH